MLRQPIEFTQHTSEDFQRLLVDQGITCSMSRRGEFWDNAAMEIFFATLKIERVFRAQVQDAGRSPGGYF